MKEPIRKRFVKRGVMPAVLKLRPLHFKQTRLMVEKAIAEGLVAAPEDMPRWVDKRR